MSRRETEMDPTEIDASALAEVRAALESSRAPLPDDAVFARQADAVMAAIVAEAAVARPRQAAAAVSPQQGWWARLRARFSEATRFEVGAWAAMAAMVLFGAFAVVSHLGSQVPSSSAPTASQTRPGAVVAAADPGAGEAPRGDGVAWSPRDQVLVDDGEELAALAAADAATLAELAQQDASQWVPSDEDLVWARLAEPGYEDLEVLSVEELVALERSLISDRVLFPR